MSETSNLPHVVRGTEELHLHLPLFEEVLQATADYVDNPDLSEINTLIGRRAAVYARTPAENTQIMTLRLPRKGLVIEDPPSGHARGPAGRVNKGLAGRMLAGNALRFELTPPFARDQVLFNALRVTGEEVQEAHVLVGVGSALLREVRVWGRERAQELPLIDPSALLPRD